MDSGDEDFADPADADLVLDRGQPLEGVSRLEGQVHVDQALAGIGGHGEGGDAGGAEGDSPIFAETKIGTVPGGAKIGTVPGEAANFEGQAVLAEKRAGETAV